MTVLTAAALAFGTAVVKSFVKSWFDVDSVGDGASSLVEVFSRYGADRYESRAVARNFENAIDKIAKNVEEQAEAQLNISKERLAHIVEIAAKEVTSSPLSMNDIMNAGFNHRHIAAKIIAAVDDRTLGHLDQQEALVFEDIIELGAQFIVEMAVSLPENRGAMLQHVISGQIDLGQKLDSMISTVFQDEFGVR